MIPDRVTLTLACAVATAGLVRTPMIQQALGFAYAVHVLRSYRRTIAGHRARASVVLR